MPSDFAIHSDLLVHWTGKDIDDRCQPHWDTEDSSATNPAAEREYVSRLRNILRFGLWMTFQPLDWDERSTASCVCFTELKLSQSRTHARDYGRLGIAVKRAFLFNRGGRPVIYYSSKSGWQSLDIFLKGCKQQLKQQHLLHFFKPMHPTDDARPGVRYKYYSESEWRIVAEAAGHPDGKQVINPRNTSDLDIVGYFELLSSGEQEKLGYLVPLDGWLAAIIYPSLALKNIVQEDDKMQTLIRQIAITGPLPKDERPNLPVQIDLDLCRNL